MPIWQLCANLLIPNCLRSNLSYSPLAALELYVKKTKPMILSDLPYAHEAASNAEKVAFFDSDNALQLSYLMEDVINNDLSRFGKVCAQQLNAPYTKSWKELFDLLLN